MRAPLLALPLTSLLTPLPTPLLTPLLAPTSAATGLAYRVGLPSWPTELAYRVGHRVGHSGPGRIGIGTPAGPFLASERAPTGARDDWRGPGSLARADFLPGSHFRGPTLGVPLPGSHRRDALD